MNQSLELLKMKCMFVNLYCFFLLLFDIFVGLWHRASLNKILLFSFIWYCLSFSFIFLILFLSFFQFSFTYILHTYRCASYHMSYSTFFSRNKLLIQRIQVRWLKILENVLCRLYEEWKKYTHTHTHVIELYVPLKKLYIFHEEYNNKKKV